MKKSGAKTPLTELIKFTSPLRWKMFHVQLYGPSAQVQDIGKNNLRSFYVNGSSGRDVCIDRFADHNSVKLR